MLIDKSQLFLKCENKKDNGIDRLVKISFAANEFHSSSSLASEKIHWNEEFFLLNKSNIWKKLSTEKKTKILLKMNEHLLREAYYIENAGMLYAAKMNILAETQEERSFFSIMGYEEARHLQNLKPFFNGKITEGDIPSFSNHIGKIILEGDKSANLFLIQILLEGWGLSYYQSLADKSQDIHLRDVFRAIIKDETRHHSAGVILLKKKQTEENTFLVDAFHDLLQMIRIGPWTLVNEIKQEFEDLGNTEIKLLLHELNAVNDTNKKLLRLKGLTEKSLSADLIKSFQKNKFWEAYSIDDMAIAHL